MSEDGAVTFRGKIYVDLARILMQDVTWEELERRLGKVYSRHDLLASLREFVEGGLTGIPDLGPRQEVAYWEDMKVSAAAGPVAVTNLCGAGGESIVEALKANGLSIATNATRVLAVTDDYLRPELEAIAENRPEWLLAKPIGHTIWIGPLFGKKEPACWWCLAHWLQQIAGNRLRFMVGTI